MLKSDRWIREMALNKRMIAPFSERVEGQKIVTYGLSSYGYDIRVTDKFKVFAGDATYGPLDPKEFSPQLMTDHETDVCIIPPNSFALAVSQEYFRLPRSVVGLVVDKSTYRRCGILVSGTLLEPEWEGFLTIEISNTTPRPAKVYAWEGIAQVLFLESDELCEVSYADRSGKYQAQQEAPTLPVVT